MGGRNANKSYSFLSNAGHENITALGGSVVAPRGGGPKQHMGSQFWFLHQEKKQQHHFGRGASRTTDGVTVLVSTV